MRHSSIDESKERLFGFNLAVEHLIRDVDDLQQALLVFLPGSELALVDLNLDVAEALGSTSDCRLYAHFSFPETRAELHHLLWIKDNLKDLVAEVLLGLLQHLSDRE